MAPSLAVGPEQIPVLCKGCGGRGEVGPDGVSVRCNYCGAVDRLPDDELGRVLDLKARIAGAARSVGQVRGIEASLAHVFESRGAILRVAGPFPLLVLVILAYVAIGTWPIVEKAPEDLKAKIAVSALMGPMWIAAFGAAFPIALLVGRRGYRKKVRPLLLARPPTQEGMPTRCRACGGDLPASREAFVRCRFCDTENLATVEVHRDRVRLLDEESRAHQQRAHGVSAQANVLSLHMTRTMIAVIVLAYAATIGAMYVVDAVL